ncbi:radical SAM family heme chaperone HemW [Pseudanabaena sp. FACHB-2040]|uniref:radical SAM family heme chaperone HemW n=1 Tax=Pseudanabaena sp. FACHB-2040 TaxID=2692859 RepID=UPI0016838552|nr:radical SAM family heme chaperone HemW [Pseudanabaena sp. FACHB-2040]MBD2258849.1 coproporphyrinogen III oxidase [Pseudanabaena sp. FACHB-2040]
MTLSPLSADAGLKTPVSLLPPQSAYIHIPFCRRRCFYCDFPIAVLGDRKRGENSGTIEQYIATLCREIAITPATSLPLQTVFFGGGTPSLLSVRQLEQVLTVLDQRFGIASGAEISMEMDPGTFDLAHLQGYLALGVNRISLGVQAFDDDLLKACGRTHTVAEVYQSAEWLLQTGVASWSLDLISGLPHQTMALWQAGLERAIALQPHHLSVYDLTVEPQTVFAHRYEAGAAPLPTDEQTADMYRLAQQRLTASGYQHYEISNYAQPGHQCRHNCTYWENRPYYGFGMGAASYVNGQRFGRPRKTREYSQWVETLEQQEGLIQCSVTSPGEQFLDHLMVGLRLAEGVASTTLARLCDGPTWQRLLQVLRPHIDKGWVCLDPQGDSADSSEISLGLSAHLRIRLSDPEGFLFSNQVLVDLFETFSDLIESDEGVSPLQ